MPPCRSIRACKRISTTFIASLLLVYALLSLSTTHSGQKLLLRPEATEASSSSGSISLLKKANWTQLLKNVRCDSLQSHFGDFIPPIVHWTGKDNWILRRHQAWLLSWRQLLGDSVAYMFWDDKRIEQLLESRYPAVAKRYRQLATGLMRGDIGRLAVLHAVGGVYADLDVQLLSDIWPLLQNYSAVWSQEPLEHSAILFNRDRLISNAVMMSRANHSILGRLLTKWPTWFDSRWLSNKQVLGDTFSALKVTGPLMINELLDAFFNDSALTPAELKDLRTTLVAEADLFQPKADYKNLNYAGKNLCSRNSTSLTRLQKRLCKRFKANGFLERERPANSFAIHHFAHTSYVGGNSFQGARPINELLPLFNCRLI